MSVNYSLYDGHRLGKDGVCVHPEHKVSSDKKCWKANVAKTLGLVDVPRAPRMEMNSDMRIIKITSDNIRELASLSGISEVEIKSAYIRAKAYGRRAYVRLGLPWITNREED